jgi:hypothetical protein
VSVSLPQLASRLGLELWQAERAVRDGLLPQPDRARRRWSEAAALQLETIAEAIRDAAGRVPDLGAWRAADYLRDKLGVPMTAGGVEELAARGQLRPTEVYKGCQLYSGTDLEAFTDKAAAEVAEAGRDRTAEQAAAYMRIREADFRLLARFGFFTPARHVNGQWARFPLYACAELDRFLARPDIDWDAVRATPRNKRTPLYYLAEPELVMATLAGLGDPNRRGRR